MKTLMTIGMVALSATLASNALAAKRQVRGTLLYEDYRANGALIDTKPIRNVKVKFKIPGLPVAIGSATTSSTGYFSVWIDDTFLSPGRTIRAEFQSKNYAADIYLDMDWVNDRLTWSSTKEVPSGTTAIDLSKTVTRSEFSVHFNILDAIQYGRSYADSRRDDDDDLTQVDVQYPDADWSHYNGFWEDITLSGPSAYGYGGNASDHGWEDGVILHEYGHHLSEDISDADSGGGSHDACSDKGYPFAWKEGFPTYFAEAVHLSRTPQVVEHGWFNLERTPSCGSPATESNTWAVLMDIHDAVGTTSSELHDRMDGSRYYGGRRLRDVIFQIFDREEPWSILSFHNALKNRKLYAGSHADLDRVYAHHGIYQHTHADYSVQSVATGTAALSPGRNFNLSLSLNNAGEKYEDEDLRIRAYTRSGTSELVLVDTTVTNFKGARNLTLAATLPASLAAGTHTIFVQVDPADRFPETDETNNTASRSVSVQVCGNNICSAGETHASCPADCELSTECGDGICHSSERLSCPADCEVDDLPPVCRKKPYLPQCRGV